MFLKHYLQLSGAKLIERVNSDWQMQMFCRVRIPEAEPVRDKDLVGRWRKFFALHGNLEELQAILLSDWKPNMGQVQSRLGDATVFESYTKFPTDVKLLWDCIEWAWRQIGQLSEKAGLKKVRWNYKRHQQRQLSYAKRRRKTRKKERARRRQLLKALWHVLDKLQGLLNLGQPVPSLVDKAFFERLRTVKTICAQQQYHYDNPGKPVPQRIVSLYKPYLRPIVRGKENKRSSLGPKCICHKWTASTSSNTSASRHSTRAGACGALCSSTASSSALCANTAATRFMPPMPTAGSSKNRALPPVSKRRDGMKKAPPGQAAQMRAILGKERATRLEGSFGNEKNHYLPHKVKARTQLTEIFWTFFGVHTANAALIGRRMRVASCRARAA